jgi:hypothetical protein
VMARRHWFRALLGSLLLGGAVLAWLVVLFAPALREAAEGARGVTSYGYPAHTDPPDSYVIVLLIAIVTTPIGLTLGPWLIASNVTRQIPKIILRAASMTFVFAPGIQTVTSRGEFKLVVLPFWWALVESGLDEKSLSSIKGIGISLLVCWVLLSAIAVSIARSQVSDTSMIVLSFSVPGLVLLSLLPCLFVPNFWPLVWAGEATIGWSLFLLLVTRRMQTPWKSRLLGLRIWLLLCAFAGGWIMVVAFFWAATWASHIT